MSYIDKYYDENYTPTKEEYIAFAIIRNLSGRRGYDIFELDEEIIESFFEDFTSIVKGGINEN